MVTILSAMLLAGLVSAACASSEESAKLRSDGKSGAGRLTKSRENALPLNRRFGSLDAYLHYLKTVSGPSDGPWYREIRPGLYQLETPLRRRIIAEGEQDVAVPLVFTREELMRKFGFSK